MNASNAPRASEKNIFKFPISNARAPGSVRLVSVRLTEPCRQVRIRFGSVGKFRIWSEPSWVTPKRPLFNKMAVSSKKKAAIRPRMK